MHIEFLPVIAVRVEGVISWGDLSVEALAGLVNSVNHKDGGAPEEITMKVGLMMFPTDYSHATDRSGY
jgi:hypothetical protein